MDNLSVLIKPASSLCNMSCDYCFYKDVASNREMSSSGIMTKSTTENLIEKAFATNAKTVQFIFQGGEPTVAGEEYFEHFVASVKTKNVNGSQVMFVLQTNGYNLSDNLIALLAKNHFLVGLSIDGNERVHNTMRHAVGGGDSFKKILTTAKKFVESGIEFNILTVVTGQIVDNIEKIYQFYKNHGFRFLQFIPCINPLDGTKNKFAITDRQYLSFLKRLFDLWYNDYMAHDYVSIRFFDNLISSYMGRPAELCGMQGHCNLQYVIEGDGTVYPCDFYCLDNYKMGNINTDSFETLSNSNNAKEFLCSCKGFSDKCKSCECFSLCKSGCKRYFDSGEYMFCNSFQDFYKHIKSRLPIIYQRIMMQQQRR